ncbi:MAG: hypothetical protein HY300_02860 [Verrucomicrobia bacterium]|nr:hypothetical protein [Verrucomicrobiota bacterium]
MQTTYMLNTKDLDERFLKSIKAAFPRRAVAIRISDESIEEDTTAYLLKSPTNRKRLLKAVAEAKAGKNLVNVTPEQLARWK